jgi:probable HAF family extracellular repeat protein
LASSEAWDVRDESVAVGWSYNSAAYKRAFYLQTGSVSLQAFNELPHLPGVTITTYNSAALGVNRFGQVVGWAQNNSGASRAFLYTPGGGGTMTDLNTLLPGGSLWVLTSARAINDAGIIVGGGTYNGQSPRCWILYPSCQE